MKTLYRKISVCLACLFLGQMLFAQHSLQSRIEAIAQGYHAKIGAAICFNGQETVTLNDSLGYAMLSTFKFPLALAVLNHLDQRQLSLETEVFVSQADLHPNTYSPLRETRPEGRFNLSVAELLRYSVSLSDNNACDILIRYLGGTDRIQNYLDSIGITGISIRMTEDQMHQKPENVYLNQARPSAVISLLEKFLSKTLLSAPYQDFLEKTLLATSTGTDKLKGLLPPETPVGHKTGSSGRNTNGMKIADNDIGFVRLPSGKYYTIAVFVMDSREDDKTNASIIARISKAAYEYYSRF